MQEGELDNKYCVEVECIKGKVQISETKDHCPTQMNKEGIDHIIHHVLFGHQKHGPNTIYSKCFIGFQIFFFCTWIVRHSGIENLYLHTQEISISAGQATCPSKKNSSLVADFGFIRNGTIDDIKYLVSASSAPYVFFIELLFQILVTDISDT